MKPKRLFIAMISIAALSLCGCKGRSPKGSTSMKEPDLPHATMLARSMEELRIKTESCQNLFQIGKASWELRQDTGIITFTSPEGIIATAPAQIIGSFNTSDKTWLWAWDNPSIDTKLAAHSKIVREYGSKRGISELTTSKFSTSEDKCWEFTALACKLSNNQGAYRGPVGDTKSFITFGEVILQKKR